MRIRALTAALFLLMTPSLAWADLATALEAARTRSRVLDAQIDDRGNLWVVVKNENISWEQFANYMCDVVRPHQARVFIAHIVDVTSVGRGKKSGEWKQLAQAACAR